MKKGQEIEIYIDALAFGGQGVGRIDNLVTFVPGAVPGDTVRAQVNIKKKQYVEARLLEILQPSPERVPAPCSYFGHCGGCKTQSLPYERQLFYKRQQVVDSFARIGHLQNVTVLDTLAAPDPIFYRNKMEFSFSDRRWLLPAEIAQTDTEHQRDFALGFHVAGHYDKIIDLHSCLLQSEWSARVVNWLRDYARQNGLEPYNVHEHKGFLRFLVIREGKNTGERMVNIVTREHAPERMAPLGRALSAAFPEVTALINNVTTNVGNVAFGEVEYLLHGKSSIDETLGSYRFRISANSFFQTNTRQAERLYRLVQELGEFNGQELVYDLYTGTGTIAIFISQAVRRVVGFELIESCILDAKANARLNNITNCEFVTADLMNLGALIRPDERPDVLIIDPPRAGMHPKTVQAVLKLLPPRIIHVSCNPTTLARDLEVLVGQGGYQIDFAQPVDMFPQTAHVEIVVRLNRRG